MELEQMQIGQQYTYFPPEERVDDNRHFPATVVAVAKCWRVRIRIVMDGAPDGVLRSVSAKRLAVQGELL